MDNSFRIRTEIGKDKVVNFELNQDFEFLEILSFKVRQSDVFSLNCANYGVVTGRVTANTGFGLPNAKVSIFIPISDEDVNNEVINAIYPYRNIKDTNEDGYRYNILPYEEIFIGSNYKSYKHKYYVMMMQHITKNSFNYDKTEVSKVEWKTYDECMQCIRPYNLEKIKILSDIHYCLINYK
jgi:hypothetical protein